MRFIKRLLCKHAYGKPKQYMRELGMGKTFIFTCEKCGRDKVKLV